MADLIGTQGSVTFAGSDGPTVTDVGNWTATFSRRKYPTTRPGYTMMRYSYGPLEVSGTLDVVVSDSVATMPIPTGVQATLTLLETSGQSYAFSAALHFLQKVSVNSLQGSQQYARYAFDGNATTSASAVTVT
jgi:hypothetical protein